MAALMCLGDQPQRELATVEAVLAEGERTGWQRVIIPSYRMRAGHPILIPSSLWLQIMKTTESLRAALRSREELLTYLNVETESILADLDTPEDYAAATGNRGE
jgi:molybdenum cofactor cytidylyltransferase